MNKQLIRNITFYIGVGLVFAAGIIYILLSDIVVNTQSLWLMLSILLSLGSAICFVVAETFKEKRIRSITLRSVGLGLAVLFIAFLLMYMLISFSPAKEVVEGQHISAFEESFAIKRVQLRGESGKFVKEGVNTMILYIVCMVITFIGMAAQVWNLIITVKSNGEE